MAWLTAAWTRPSLRAAAEKLPASATARSVRSCSIVTPSSIVRTHDRKASGRPQAAGERGPSPREPGSANERQRQQDRHGHDQDSGLTQPDPFVDGKAGEDDAEDLVPQ